MTSTVEAAKAYAAQRAVEEHFSPNFTFIGIGSGSTITYVVEAIARVLKSQAREPCSSDDQRRLKPTIGAYGMVFVPTGYQSQQLIVDAGLQPMLFDQLSDDVVLDVAFDGADEVDDELNCIKGGGACLFQEKLVATRAKKWVCVADFRKAQSHLLSFWPSIPIEVAPIAAPSVLKALKALGSKAPAIRLNPLNKSGPLRTDQGFYIIDAPFSRPLLLSTDNDAGNGKDGLWHVLDLATRINAITGVLEVGLFCGVDGIEASKQSIGAGGQKPVVVYFGMEDGSVEVRFRRGGISV